MSIKSELNEFNFEKQEQALFDNFIRGLDNIDKTSAVAVPVLMGIAVAAPLAPVSVTAASAAIAIVFAKSFAFIEEYCSKALKEINESNQQSKDPVEIPNG